jgi:predicted nucleic acid-binding protein
MILADSSAWVEYDRATGSAAHYRLWELIAEQKELVVTEPVEMEVYIGARDDQRESELRGLLSRFSSLPLDSGADFDSAVTIYRRCRRAGVTPRGSVDCLIAAVAQRNGAFVLAHDIDFARVADVIGLDLDEASLGAGGPTGR